MSGRLTDPGAIGKPSAFGHMSIPSPSGQNSRFQKTYLGWDIGGTKSAAIIGNAEGKILDRAQWPSEVEKGPLHMQEQFIRHAEDLLRTFEVDALGVSVGGPINTLEGVILSPPHLPGWDNIHLRDNLFHVFGKPVFVEHDAIACLKAEIYWGAARGLTHAAYLTAGTGCGAGVISGGHILRGPNGESPELGHVRIAADGPLVYGKNGCVESFCSGTGVCILAHMRFPQRFGADVDLYEVERSARAGEREGLAVLEESGRALGDVCAMLVDVFAVQRVIVGSLARYLPALWLNAARKRMAEEILPQFAANGVEIVPAQCGKQLQDLSAIAPCVGCERDTGKTAFVPTPSVA